MRRIIKENISEFLVRVWNGNEIRILVVSSLFLQIVLIVTGNRRKYISHPLLKGFIWIAYQSADWVATFALGAISRSQCGHDSESVDPNYIIMAFWAPFLLMHLAGPDTITAYALADNELWLRHFLNLIGRAAISMNIFLTSWKHTPLNILALLAFLPGLIKYGERTWVLYSASRSRFRKSVISKPDPGPNYAKFMDEYVARKAEGYRVSLGRAVDVSQIVHNPPIVTRSQIIPEVTTLNDAFYFFETFKKLFADLILSFQDRKDSQSFFREKSWDMAFSIVEVELGLIYDTFYTKVPLIYSFLGFCLRILSLSSTLAIFIAFVIIKKDQFSIKEVSITWTLSIGAFVLEIYAILILASSDRSMILLTDNRKMVSGTDVMNRTLLFLSTLMQEVTGLSFHVHSPSEIPQSQDTREPCFPCFVYKVGSLFQILHIVPAKKRWSNTMGLYNFFGVSLNEKPAKCIKLQKLFGVRDLLEKYRYGDNVRVPNVLKEQIFLRLQKRLTSGMNQYDYRGDLNVLAELNCFDKVDEVEFDQSLLFWHIATDLCYYDDAPENQELHKSSKCKLREWICCCKSNESKLCYYDDVPENPELHKSSKCKLREWICCCKSNESKRQMEWIYSYKLNEGSSSEEVLRYKRLISKLLSEYMLYLLVCCPFMLPSGIGQTRYQDSLAEAAEFFKEHKSVSSRKQACSKLLQVNTNFPPSQVKGDRSKSVLFDACILAKSLQCRQNKWEIILQVWVDMLSYAAAQCRSNDHAEQLREGGQLLTHVWLLMAHFGMTDQFQISQGNIRAKWQVN